MEKISKENLDNLKNILTDENLMCNEFEEFIETLDVLDDLTDAQFDLLVAPKYEEIRQMLNDVQDSLIYQLYDYNRVGYEDEYIYEAFGIEDIDDEEFDEVENLKRVELTREYHIAYEDNDYYYFEDLETFADLLENIYSIESSFSSYNYYTDSLAEHLRVEYFNCCEYGERI